MREIIRQTLAERAQGMYVTLTAHFSFALLILCRFRWVELQFQLPQPLKLAVNIEPQLGIRLETLGESY